MNSESFVFYNILPETLHFKLDRNSVILLTMLAALLVRLMDSSVTSTWTAATRVSRSFFESSKSSKNVQITIS